ncbi:hypothetical protein TcasGA2_TC031944 [Tribolium castaneum]|uniref:Uncharacterized protein n=1 Tax=Tribolium castaneum TaxID=7070 RepID=A0A139W9R9_TRICA|nr:hypothetical protein TcasGA2_TC031944 [Tribolium castaneum]
MNMKSSFDYHRVGNGAILLLLQLSQNGRDCTEQRRPVFEQMARFRTPFQLTLLMSTSKTINNFFT